MNYIYKISLLLISILFFACQGETQLKEEKKEIPVVKTKKVIDDFMYDFKDPNKKYKVNKKLKEISGIHYLGDHKFACIQDEKGEIFIYDVKKEEVVDKIKFSGDGDFEDIEIVGKDAYVIRSDGRLFIIKNYRSENPDIKYKQTQLIDRNDVEGLCYDKKNNVLLIACKGQAGIKEIFYYTKSIFEFDLGSFELNPEPKFVIDKRELSKRAGKKIDFAPSGLAIHPITNEIYVIGTVGKLLLRLSPKGKFLKAKKLDNDIFKQPEGICFEDDGTLYISNEGRDGKANILKFNYKKNN